jgi:hypothetical protein
MLLALPMANKMMQYYPRQKNSKGNQKQLVTTIDVYGYDWIYMQP